MREKKSCRRHFCLSSSRHVSERQMRALWGDKLFFFFVNPLGFLSFPSLAPLLPLCLSVSPLELRLNRCHTPTQRTLGATHTLWPRPATVLKKAVRFFIQTNGTSSSASRHPFLTFPVYFLPWTCRLCHCASVVKLCIYYDFMPCCF